MQLRNRKITKYEQWWIQDLQTGAKDEVPSGVGYGEGCPLSRQCPLPIFFFYFKSQNGDFRCILGTIFTVQLFGL